MPTFKEIEKFPHCPYSVNIPWNYIESWLKDQSEFYDLNIDPPYQRGYVWTAYQQSAYVEFQLKGGRSGREILWNCPTWSGMSSKGDSLELVDGKQRLTAIRLFLENKVSVFGYYFKDFSDKLHSVNHTLIFSVNSLQSREEIVKWYLDFNTGGSIHTEEDLSPAYEYLKTLL